MGSSHADTPRHIQQSKVDMKENVKNAIIREPETFSDMCELLGIKGGEATVNKTEEDTPTTKSHSNLPLLKKKTHQLQSLGIDFSLKIGLNIPKVDRLMRNAHNDMSNKHNAKGLSKSTLELDLPLLLRTVKPWSSGVPLNSSRVIYMKKLKPLEVILRKNCKPIPTMSDIVKTNADTISQHNTLELNKGEREKCAVTRSKKRRIIVCNQ